MKKILLSMMFALLIPFGAVAQVAYAVYENGTLTFYYDNLKSSRSGTAYELNTGENDPGWFTDHRLDITKAVFDSSFANARPTTIFAWLAGEPNLSSIEGIENLNTNKVTDMGLMFSGCSGLTSLDLSCFNTISVTNMGWMFSVCSSLTSLDLRSFNTSSVTDMAQMFNGCSSLTSLDLSSFDTSSVTDMSLMFNLCSNLTSLDLSEFDPVIENDTTDHNYRPCAFVQRQRYTTLEKICAASFTSQLL